MFSVTSYALLRAQHRLDNSSSVYFNWSKFLKVPEIFFLLKFEATTELLQKKVDGIYSEPCWAVLYNVFGLSSEQRYKAYPLPLYLTYWKGIIHWTKTLVTHNQFMLRHFILLCIFLFPIECLVWFTLWSNNIQIWFNIIRCPTVYFN